MTPSYKEIKNYIIDLLVFFVIETPQCFIASVFILTNSCFCYAVREDGNIYRVYGLTWNTYRNRIEIFLSSNFFIAKNVDAFYLKRGIYEHNFKFFFTHKKAEEKSKRIKDITMLLS